MSPTLILVLLATPLVLAFGYGIWVGLGYPGLYDRHEKTGRTPRKTPWEMLVDWVVDRLDV